MRKIISILLTLAMILPMVAVPVKAEAKTVSSFDELKAAIADENVSEITLTSNIILTETLVISDKTITINGTGTISADSQVSVADPAANPNVKNTLFAIKNSTVTFDGLTLDGNNQNRVIYSEGSELTFSNATITKGCPGDNSTINPGGGIFLIDGSLTATNTDFIGNTPGTNSDPTLQAGDRDLNGGAIYTGKESANITITGGKFEDNEVKAYGHGAAIYQENGSLTVTGTSFKNNKGHVEGGNAGTQGACIHTRDGVTATISNVTAEIAKGFNTGGFLRSLGSDVTVTNSEFKIENLGDGYGYSGGALCFQNGTSKVTGSTFTCTGSKLFHAGGFIDIVGTGTHVIDNNTMTGAGKENGQQIASFGGAISVEEGASATVTIKDNTITGTSASDNGGAIAIGTHKGKSTPSTVTMSGNTISNAGTLFWGAQHGGGVFIGPDAKVTMSNDTMSDTRSSYGGGVYNEGELTITGGSSLTGGVGSKLGGEIYNNGDLTVDDATITGSFVGGAAWQQYASHGKNFEFGGTNIYAEKDVTITPNANITTGKDVRVLDGQSKILLTGTLTKEIDVSVSEVAGGSESQSRKVGYVVAAGKDGYKATYSDANFLHYIGRTNKEDANHYSNQPRAEFSDHESLGVWDFVLNPKTKDVVLGQRVKLTLDANGEASTPAEFKDVSAGRDEEEGILTKLPSTDKKEDIYDIYAPGPKSAILAPEPVRKNYAFTGWYKESSVSDNAPDEGKPNKTKVNDQKLVENAGEITSIIDPNEYTLYAGWEKVILVEKVWNDEENKYGNRPDSVTVKLLSRAKSVADPIELTAENGWKGEFKNIRPSKFRYTVEEDPKQSPGYEEGVVSGNDKDGFKITNKTEFIDIEGSKTWVHGENPKEKQPTEVTVTLYENGNATNNSKTGNSWKFENLPKYKNKTLVNYTLTENPVDHYSSTQNGYNFTNTFTNKFKVTYEFVSADSSKTLPKGVTDQLPKEETDKENNTKVTPSTSSFNAVEENDGTWTFQSWSPAEHTINGSDVKFVGTWKFTPKTYKVTYKFESGTEGKTLPQGVTNQLPNEETGKANGATVTPSTSEFNSVVDGNGTWSFKSWDQNSKTINKADVTFTGTWEYSEEPKDTYKVKYEFVSGTEGKTLPAAIEGYKPTDTTDYADGATVTAKDPTTKTFEDTTNNGTWTFQSWNSTSQTVNGADVKFVGTWTFAAKSDPEQKSEFSVTKTVDKKEFEKAGEELKYTVIVTNTGEKDLTGLTISDDKTTFENPTFDLKKGESKEFKYTYTVTEDDVKAKSITNTATVTYGDDSKKSSTTSKLKEDEPQPDPEPRPDPKPEPKPEPDPGYWYEPSPPYLREDPKEEPVEEKPVEEKPIERPELNKDDHKIYMFGYPDWTFKPEGEMTRGEAAAMFARLFKEYPGDNYNYHEDFSDVDENYWCYKEIAYLAEWGIINGYEDGTFKPDNKISRAEFVKIVESFEALQTGTNPYSDVTETYWAYKYIVSSSAKGWINGYLDGTFKPDNNISRSEAVKIANKLVNRHPDKDFIDRNKYLLKDFIDLPTSHWAYYEIHEAANGHIFERLANGMDERWLEVNEERFVFTPPKYHYNK